MLDVGHAWDAHTTLERARLFEPYDLFWIEEPLHPDDLDGYAVVSAECETPIAAGEEECTVAGFNRLMEIGGVDVVQVDLSRAGLTQAMTIAMLAQSSGIPVVNHNFTTDINVAASLHFLASVPNAFVMEESAAAGAVETFDAGTGAVEAKAVVQKVEAGEGVEVLDPQHPGRAVHPEHPELHVLELALGPEPVEGVAHVGVPRVQCLGLRGPVERRRRHPPGRGQPRRRGGVGVHDWRRGRGR